MYFYVNLFYLGVFWHINVDADKLFFLFSVQLDSKQIIYQGKGYGYCVHYYHTSSVQFKNLFIVHPHIYRYKKEEHS